MSYTPILEPNPVEESYSSFDSSKTSEPKETHLYGERTGVVARILKKNREPLFMTLLSERDDVTQILENIYTAYLIKKRYPEFKTLILVHEKHAELFGSSPLFDQVHTFKGKTFLREKIHKFKPDVLFMPDPSVGDDISTILSSAKLCIAGRSLYMPTRFFRFLRSGRIEDIEKLKTRGLNLLPEPFKFQFVPDLTNVRVVLPKGDLVWLSIFDKHDLQSDWSVAHVARLSRLLTSYGLKLVIHVPAMRSEKQNEDIEYLKKSAENIYLAENLTPLQRAKGMMYSRIVVGASGSELMLATLLKLNVIAIHDMRLNRFCKGMDAALNIGHAEYIKHLHHSKSFSLMLGGVNGSQEQIHPNIEKCNDHCVTCNFTSCLDYISPERVFESIKQNLVL